MKGLESLKQRLISVDDVCEAFQISKKTLERWRKDLGFPDPIGHGRRAMNFDQSMIEDWLEYQKKLNEKKLRPIADERKRK